MKKPAVYLETSFINYLADPLKRDAKLRQNQLSSREWWNILRHQYTLLTSTFTVDESCRNYPNQRIVRLRQRCLASVTIIRPPAADRIRLATALREPYGPLPSTEVLDSQHIATAALSGCHFLLTWNQKHIANPFISKRVDNIIEGYGYQAPIIATPDQFLEADLG
jgi:hypothetical protein